MHESSDDPVLASIRNPVELRDTEYKESQPFDVYRYKIAKAAMALANLRDGGRIIIGVHEREGRLRAEGVTVEHEASYNPDRVIEAINYHARPPVNCVVRVVADADRRFVVIEVQPFDRIPVFCKNGTPDDVSKNDRLTKGQLYVRSNERIATTRVVDPDLMAELLEIAGERRASEIVRVAQRAGFTIPNNERSELRVRLLDILPEGQVDDVLEVLDQFARRAPTVSRKAFERERHGFEPNE